MVLAAGPSVARADITIAYWDLITLAYDYPEHFSQAENYTVTLPLPPSPQSVSIGSSSAKTTYDFSITGDSATFGFLFDHARAGAAGAAAYSLGDLWFTVGQDQNLPYTITGAYAMTGGNRIGLAAVLTDLGTGSTFFSNSQESRITANEAFHVGGTDGDYGNVLLGNQSGTLVAGHTYSFLYSADITNLGAADSGASALGDLTLWVNTQPIPVPGAALLGVIGLAAVGWWQKSRGRSARSAS
jgi:hypothetical protein